MTLQILTALGGLGLFLLGMMVMTNGLRALAGDSLQLWLKRFTNSPASGALTGTVATAILQSSSATTVSTVGFVAAGLLTFPQALGVVFGANLGTTVTGWMVALLGFKLKIGAVALPVVFIGMMLNMFGRGRWSDLGRTVAGFGVLFVGIGFMQQGMGGFQEALSPASFPPDTWGGRLLLVALGAALVLVTQSSSAGVAIAMTALSAGAINFPQAACLVIGMDVGTTVTAVLASLGSSDAARRTGLSHTIYNVFTAIGALLILDAYIWLTEWIWPGAIQSNPEIALVGFHTAFNVLALAVGLPLARPFADLMERLVPKRDAGLTWRLDDRLLAEPGAAEAAIVATLKDEFAVILEWLRDALGGAEGPRGMTRHELLQDLRNTRDYLDRTNRLVGPGHRPLDMLTSIHAMDHLHRMYWRLRQREIIETVNQSGDLSDNSSRLREVSNNLSARLGLGIPEATYMAAEKLAARLKESSPNDRDRAISHAVQHDLSIAQTAAWLDARRWLARMSHHVWRISAHLGGYEVGEEEPD